MHNRVILRTISNISFAGILTKDVVSDGKKGVTIKMSDESDIKIWCPYDEIESIIFPDGKTFYKSDLENLNLTEIL